ncbi:MAG: DNA-directed RNA polymerase subunit D, partial [Fervidicoccaceae archaeon]
MSGESGDGGWRVEVLERSEDKLSLLFDGVPLHLLAALRRAVIEEVPTMAVSAVMFLENSSALHDEVLAHRLAMIPLRSEEALRKYRPPEECRECVDCENCTTKLYLDVKNVDLDELTVYSGDLKPEDPDVRPVHDRVPIVKLARGQSIALEAEARLGRGREHAKWSPVTVAVVVAVPRVTFDFSRVSEKELEECLGCLEGLSRELAERVRRE